MNKLFFLIFPVLLFSCGDKTNEEVEEVVKLETQKDRLSYVLGSMNAKTIVGTQDPNIDKLDLEQIAIGFGDNLNGNKPTDCEATLIKLFGPNFQDFDSTYAKEGAQCLGKLTGYAFYQDMIKMGGLSSVDMNMVKIGFRHGLLKKDTLIADTEKQTIIQNFIKDLNVKNGKKMMEKAAKIKGAQVFENGIVMEVISEGKGGSPSATDDVKVEYILISALGDTIQSSYKMKLERGSKDPVPLSLSDGVVPGWTFILPKMKKGGKYKIYIPWELAYGEQMPMPFESLCFVIELIDIGKKGTFVKKEAEINPTQGF